MSTDIVGIHVCVDGNEDKEFKSITIEKEDDAVTKMSWITDFNVKEQEYFSNEPYIVGRKTLLIGQFYTPYSLQVSLSRLKSGHFQYQISVTVSSTNEHPLEDKKQDSSSKKHSDEPIVGCKPVFAIWISLNENEKIPLDRMLEQEVWTPSKHFSFKLDPPYTYRFGFQLWFKLIDVTALPAQKNALKQLSALYINQTLCDINFLLKNDKSVGGHKHILAARSPVFAAMFQDGIQEAKTGQVAITDIELDTFKVMLYFIYSSKLGSPLTEDKAKLLIVAANKYAIEDLKNICLSFLLPQIRIDNVIHLLVWAHNYSVDKMKEATLEFVAVNFEKMCLTEEWARFTTEYPNLNVLATREMIKKKTGYINSWMGEN